MILDKLINDYMKKLKEELSQKRYEHSIGVMDTCEKLAIHYNQDIGKAKIAGLLHDCARELTNEELKEVINRSSIQINEIEEMHPILLHGKVGAIYAMEKYGISDIEILNAIACHSTGRWNMTEIDKIVFLSDYIEPGRKSPHVEEVRDIVYNNIENALVVSYKKRIIYEVGRGNMLHPDSVSGYNWLLSLQHK